MSNEFNLGKPKWEDDEQAIEGSGNTKFAKARFYYPLHVNRFVGGEHFTLPGVFYDEYDEDTKVSTRIGQKEFRGMTLSENSKYHLALVVLESKNKEGQWYQRQIQFGNWKDKDEETGDYLGCAWLDFQKKEMLQLSVGDRAALIEAATNNSWAFIQYTEAETGYTGQYEIKKYLTDIVVFKNEKEWGETEKTFRSQFSDNDTPSDSPYPVGWGDSEGIEKNLVWAKKEAIEKKWTDELAVAGMGIAGTKTPNGNPVNVKWLVSEVLNKPEAMVNLSEDVVKGEVPF